LGEVGKIICGKTPSKANKKFYGEDIPFIKIPDMHGQMFVVNTIDNLSNLGAISQKKKMIPTNSICVSCIATVGLVSLTVKNSQTNQQINSIVRVCFRVWIWVEFESILSKIGFSIS
jgi:type I restriction enzyme S subunit